LKTHKNKHIELIHNNSKHVIASSWENANVREVSYKVSLLVAKTGKDHNVVENMTKLVAKIMANNMLGGKKRQKTSLTRCPFQMTLFSVNQHPCLKM
jgi:tyrosine-protein phosphatase YwqE